MELNATAKTQLTSRSFPIQVFTIESLSNSCQTGSNLEDMERAKVECDVDDPPCAKRPRRADEDDVIISGVSGESNPNPPQKRPRRADEDDVIIVGASTSSGVSGGSNPNPPQLLSHTAQSEGASIAGHAPHEGACPPSSSPLFFLTKVRGTGPKCNSPELSIGIKGTTRYTIESHGRTFCIVCYC